MRKILIDVNPVVPLFVSGQLSGIGRTTKELVCELDKLNDLPFEIHLFSQNMKGVGAKNLATHFDCHHLYLPNRIKINKLSAFFHCREIMTRYDLMHITHNFEYVSNPEKCVVTIHDAMFYSYPESFLGHEYARLVYPKLAQKAKAIITCSQNSRREIIEYMRVDPNKVFVTPWGIDLNLFKPQNIMSNRFTGVRPYFISVSCDVGRKNTISVLKAFRKYTTGKKNHALILVWRTPPVEIIKEYRDLISEQRLFFVSNIDDNELSELYSMATATFFPSRYEGFGLPILESMASGTPVITCKNSSLEEVGGAVAIYVEPDDIDTMCDIMLEFDDGKVGYPDIIQKGIKHASTFTWQRCANLTLDVYRRCLE